MSFTNNFGLVKIIWAERRGYDRLVSGTEHRCHMIESSMLKVVCLLVEL